MRVADVDAMAERLEAMLAGFDAYTWEGKSALRLVRSLARLERLVVAAKTLALAQVQRTEAWEHDGKAVRSPADWLAAATGVPQNEAIRDVETAKHLEQAPATETALRKGRLSAAQAREITSAAAEAPEAETSLLALAESGQPFSALREEAGRVKAAAADQAQRAERQRRLRGARRYTDAEGMRRYQVALTPEQALHFEPVWDACYHQVFDAARRAGQHDSAEAYAADALVVMAGYALQGSGTDPGGENAAGGHANSRGNGHQSRSGLSVRALLLADLAALRRGHTVAGETCEIAGIGPTDVAAARSFLGDAAIDILVRDGVDVRTVAHVGRNPNSRQRAALMADWTCEVRGCTSSRHLEIDHLVPVADGGPTALDNLGPKCRFHHRLKTHEGWHDGPRGPDGKRDLLPPETPDEPDDNHSGPDPP